MRDIYCDGCGRMWTHPGDGLLHVEKIVAEQCPTCGEPEYWPPTNAETVGGETISSTVNGS